MAQEGRGSRAQAVIAIVLVLLGLQLLHNAKLAESTTYTVGDENGWSNGVSYWPNGKTFYAGDVLALPNRELLGSDIGHTVRLPGITGGFKQKTGGCQAVGKTASKTIAGGVFPAVYFTVLSILSSVLLEFKYLKNSRNVLELTDYSDYEACTARSYTNAYVSGDDYVELRSGNTYFIDGIPGHCSNGAKIAVTAL
ncbi:Chemocyanin [Dendrobium catenatum]|uniref:Chemocyanin n=1 Tax=Dendrobium catenatum TaxID=906689 RepID=A0A2I0WAR1_9ASPA|nr:Chemocyanin [Dendrobium catenatum]